MDLNFTLHAEHVMEMRNINVRWVFDTVENPELRVNDLSDPDVERFYRRIPERESRVLRVAVNTKLLPWSVVSVFFDRRMKGKL